MTTEKNDLKCKMCSANSCKNKSKLTDELTLYARSSNEISLEKCQPCGKYFLVYRIQAYDDLYGYWFLVNQSEVDTIKNLSRDEKKVEKLERIYQSKSSYYYMDAKGDSYHKSGQADIDMDQPAW